jgi:hypothetical protein
MISSIGDDVSATVRIDLGHFVLAVARCQRVQVFAYDVASFEVVASDQECTKDRNGQNSHLETSHRSPRAYHHRSMLCCLAPVLAQSMARLTLIAV